ncbi:MAG TPA: hypothetical protein VF045_09745 [Acidimicrobiales bacterium]
MSDFSVTHVAPPEGLQAWQAPDPSVQPVAQVQAGVHMQLLERRGAWAHVRFSNGWSGWVDGRRIVEAQPPPRPSPVAEPARPAEAEPSPTTVRDEPAPTTVRDEPAPTAAAATSQPDLLDDPFAGLEPGLRPEPAAAARPGPPEPARAAIRPDEHAGARSSDDGDGRDRRSFDVAGLRPIPALLGAGTVLLGTFFAWITIDDADGNAYDVPLEFLWNHESASGGGLKVGLLLLALAGAVGALCFLPGKVKLRRIIGVAIIAITLVYVVQLQRALSDAGDAAPGLVSALGFGVLLTLVGAAAIVYDPAETALES